MSQLKVTQVAIRPTERSNKLERPSLTPELLAASGARYSRNNEGLDAILAKIDWNNLDKSVDGIFRMVDYGHASIADMCPVALFIDGVSIWLASYVWALSPTAGGQESSTRYIRLTPEGLPVETDLGLTDAQACTWRERMNALFSAYQHSLAAWEAIGAKHPDQARIPKALLDDTSEKAKKAVARMRRNYAFDRARYLLPAAASTNFMMVMSARAWVTLIQHLLSHPLQEAQELGAALRAELEIAAPRMVRHARVMESLVQGQQEELAARAAFAQGYVSPCLELGERIVTAPCMPALDIHMPKRHVPQGADYAQALAHHDNRYAYVGEALKRVQVTYSWDAVSFADYRDLNRHRTGTKYYLGVPVGFYGAIDQLPEGIDPDLRQEIVACNQIGQVASAETVREYIVGNPAAVYEMPLGAQMYFEHSTSAWHFLYTAELRTGVGAHYRYAGHMRDVLALWYERMPETKGLVLEGSAEPE